MDDLERLPRDSGLSIEQLPVEPITEEQYDLLKDSAFGEETDEQRAEREKLMENDTLGVKVPELEIADGERMQGTVHELLPEEEFGETTADW